MSIRTAGFSPIILIMAIVATCVVGFITWRIFDVRWQTGQASTANQPGQQQVTDPNAGFVVINEWGVRFKPVEGAGTVIHKAWPTQTVTGVEGVKLPEGSVKIVLSTQELADRSNDCNVNHNSTAVWEMYRTSQSLGLAQTVTIGKIGDYYYYYFGAQAACVTNPADYDLNSTTSGKLRESLKTLEGVQ